MKVQTRTGVIYYDIRKQLEWLCVGDYGKQNNIKANFLGLSNKIDGVQHKDVDMSKKMVVTISTQKGCQMNCDFCDVPRYGYHGNASFCEMLDMIIHSICEAGITKTERLNIHFARMGEPTFNRDVIKVAKWLRTSSLSKFIGTDIIHPVVSTMLPKSNKDLESFLLDWCLLKNGLYEGEAGLQFSINSTDDEQRNNSFKRMSLQLSEISRIGEMLPFPNGRKCTLNFAVTKDTILDAKKLDEMFDLNKFIVKITPIHQTTNALCNGYNIANTYDKYDVYNQFEEPLLELGWDVIVFIPSKEEDEDRITCGNALLSSIPKI